MSHLYSLEFLIQKINIETTREVIRANIECGDLFKFSITYKLKASNLDVYKTDGIGKAVLFACPIDILISSFITALKVTITDIGEEETLGNAQIPMDDSFADEIKNFDSENRDILIDRNVTITDEDGTVGSMTCKLCLISYGISVEVSITTFGSQLAIPLDFRKPVENWDPIFYAQKKEHKSMLDPRLAFYAHMAGVVMQPPMTNLLTAEYINKHLCGNKACPGARKFKDYGLGPLAPPGAGLGSISTLKDIKPSGIYGMSQSYGTLDNYGAYGLFVKKPTNAKSCCGSPDCPYTIFYGKSEESFIEIMGEDGPTPSLAEGYENDPYPRKSIRRVSTPRGSNLRESAPQASYPRGSTARESSFRGSVRRSSAVRQSYAEEKKCTCKQCKGSQSSKDSNTCGSPSCPKKFPKPVKCPFLNKPPRQAAGADRNPNCPNYAARRSYGQSGQFSGPNRNSDCPSYNANMSRRNYGQADQCTPSNCPNTFNEPKTSETSGTVGACGGQICPFHKVPGTCPGEDTCPFISCLGPGQLRPVKPEPVEERRRSSNGKHKSCLDKTCEYREPDDIMEGEEEGDGLCGGKICPLDRPERNSYGGDERRRSSTNNRRKSSITERRRSSRPKNKSCLDKTCEYYQAPEEEQETGLSDTLCGGKICPLDRSSYRRISDDVKTRKLSLLIGEEGKKFLFGGEGGFDVSRELLSTLSLGENTDIYYVISRLLGEKKQSSPVNNYLTSESSPDFKTFDKVERKKQKRRGPCRKDSCKIFKYKTCSECGGLSRSGATCDNTDVSFSTISYDSMINTIEAPEMLPEPPKIEAKSALKKDDKTEQLEKTVMIRKPKKKKTRFVYLGGEDYPGVKIGHKTCGFPPKIHRNVPARMGWLWNAEKRKKTWRPGFLSKEIEACIIENRKAKGIPDPPEIKAIAKRGGGAGYALSDDDEEEEEVLPKPTLIIQKKDGDYLITLHPLKDPHTLVERENPYMRCKPIQFIITKPKKPPPPPPIITTYPEIAGEFEGEGEDYIPFYNNTCLCDEPDTVSSSSSDSELNIEFTTPAGIIIPERFQRPPNVINVSTQFLEADFHCEDCPIIVPKKFKKEKKKKK